MGGAGQPGMMPSQSPLGNEGSDIKQLSSRGIHYNWPYDYFSIIELAKLDAEVAFTFDSPLRKPKFTVPSHPAQIPAEAAEAIRSSTNSRYTPHRMPSPGELDFNSGNTSTTDTSTGTEGTDSGSDNYLDSDPIKEIEERLWEYYMRRYDYWRDDKGKWKSTSAALALAETYVFGYTAFGWYTTAISEVVERFKNHYGTGGD